MSNSKEVEFIDLFFTLDGCPAGVDASPENPLARATRQLWQTGQPYKRLTKCFYRDETDSLRWAGIFVLSQGGRLLFFPGHYEPNHHTTGYIDDALRWDRPFQIDHISLERDRRTWHLTTPQSRAHLGDMYTTPLGEGRLHWFTMSVASEAFMRKVLRETKAEAIVSPTDTHRSMDVFLQSREDAVFQILQLNPAALRKDPYYLNFAVVVGPPGFKSVDTGHVGPMPPGAYGSESSSHVEIGLSIPLRSHRVTISRDTELEIATSIGYGSLTTKFMFGSGGPS